MVGEENLIPFSERSKAEARENGRKGGIASGKTRRKKANIRRALETVLNLDIPDSKLKSMTESLGLDTTIEQGMVLSVVLRAMQTGDYKALQSITGLLGQNLSLADKREQKARTDRMNAETLKIEKELAIKTGEEGAGIAVMQQTAIANMINTPETERVLQDFLGPAEEVENASEGNASGDGTES